MSREEMMLVIVSSMTIEYGTLQYLSDTQVTEIYVELQKRIKND